MDYEKLDFLEEGTIAKSAEIQIQDVTDEDLRKINKYTLSPLKAEDVFTFKTIIGDNETDDRNYEPFNLNALKDLARLYPGKTVIKDHRRTADNQVARIYDTETVTEPRLTKAGEPFTKIVAKNYMVRTASNADLIKEIEAGIKKEVSTGVRPKRLICNICGSDNMKTYCPHWPGREYDKESGKTTCLMTIDGAKEAYELSLVAVPAQPRAGTIKHYGPKPPEDPEDKTVENDDLSAENAQNVQKPDLKTENQKSEPEPAPDTENKDLETDLRIKALESFIFTQVNENSEMKGEINE